jgi:carboxyl-terminal processing protease
MTASASESTIIGLQPYMTVTTIGATTYGKCYGGPIFNPSDYKSSWSSLDSWMLYCIGYKTANASGYTDFYDGITPTLSVDQDIETVPVGDESDGLLSVALAKITGTSATTKSSSRVSLLKLNKSWVNAKGILRTEQYQKLPVKME